MGAAILAAYGLGWYNSIEECVEQFIQTDTTFEPNIDRHHQYQYYFNIYKDIYKQTKEITAMLIR